MRSVELKRLPVCAAWSAVSSPRASCPARQSGLLSRREGEFTTLAGIHAGWVTAPPPQASRNPHQRSATGSSVSTGSLTLTHSEMKSRVTQISASYSQVHKYPHYMNINSAFTGHFYFHQDQTTTRDKDRQLHFILDQLRADTSLGSTFTLCVFGSSTIIPVPSLNAAVSS